MATADFTFSLRHAHKNQFVHLASYHVKVELKAFVS
jgi:hypothetical protein